MQISIRRMLIGCSIVFCVVSLWIIVTFPSVLIYFSWVTVSCTFLPIPTPQVVMDFGQRFDPLLLAVIGGIGFCISALIDYSLVTFAFRHKKVNRIRTTRIYRCVERFFSKAPFAILVTAAFTPLPVDPVKLVACANRYNRAKYILACFVGRVPRYYLLARLQRALPIPREYLYGSILALVIMAAIKRLIKRPKNRNEQHQVSSKQEFRRCEDEKANDEKADLVGIPVDPSLHVWHEGLSPGGS